MIHLSGETEVLARRLAAAQGVSIEQIIKQALERSAREAGISPQLQSRRDTSPTAVAARRARLNEIADEISKMPILDTRSPDEIMDDLNAP